MSAQASENERESARAQEREKRESERARERAGRVAEGKRERSVAANLGPISTMSPTRTPRLPCPVSTSGRPPCGESSPLFKKDPTPLGRARLAIRSAPLCARAAQAQSVGTRGSRRLYLERSLPNGSATWVGECTCARLSSLLMRLAVALVGVLYSSGKCPWPRLGFIGTYGYSISHIWSQPLLHEAQARAV